MAVILRTMMSGPSGSFPPGSRAEFDAATERQLVDGGYAVFEKPATRGEMAAMRPAETAAMPVQPQPTPETRGNAFKRRKA